MPYPPQTEGTLHQIERTLLATRPPPGHKYWGFTIFRATYKDDAAWSQLVAFLENDARETLRQYEAEVLMESLRLTVFEDPQRLDGASKHVVKQMFREWRSSPRIEHERDGSAGQPILVGGCGATTRYRYCMHIDEDALCSIIDRQTNEPKEVAWRDGYVNLIDASWELEDPVERAEACEKDPDAEDLYDEGEEPIEGCRLWDVGWMRMSAGWLMPDMYGMLHWVDWDVNYRRSPAVAVW